ncbi:hypothetical protein KV097_18655 [Mumia sp. zg.B17]|uniref:hypothetical protein n=1 Tax=Mumia sp. zg.B17 TaxID=2855446 RepID=UPI001C6E21CB|nr:hypothetical protein [Mumia sp. zg.B17]MBW9207964.1 hypothetical protein [Mumia sp. zg.B17]
MRRYEVWAWCWYAGQFIKMNLMVGMVIPPSQAGVMYEAEQLTDGLEHMTGDDGMNLATIRIQFRDAAGQFWQRDHDGTLTPIEDIRTGGFMTVGCTEAA